MEDKPCKMIAITVKNYNYKNGVSTTIHQKDEGSQFILRGPFGKGLQIQTNGTHIAFCAGTGILVFLDLVAHLIRKNLGLLTKEENYQINGRDFKFILHASFP